MADNLAQGPELVGGRIAWLDYKSSCTGGCNSAIDDYTETKRYSLRVMGSRRKPRVLYTTGNSDGSVGGGTGGFTGRIGFGLSGSFLAISATEDFESRDVSTFDVRLAAGARPRPPGQADLATLLDCTYGGFSGRNGAFALSGALLAYDSTPCREGEGARARLTFRNLQSGRSRLERLSPGSEIRDLAAAGDFAAAAVYPNAEPQVEQPSEGPEYLVSVFRQGQPGPLATVPVGRSRPSIDQQRDGRVALCTEDRQLATFSPASPTLRRLGSCNGAVSIARDRLVFRSLPTGGLHVIDLAGRRGTIAQLGRVGTLGLDFDGRRVAYGMVRCRGGAAILATTVTTRGRGRPFVKCPVHIRSRGRLTVRRDGRTSFALGCPRGCDGFFELLRAGETLEFGLVNSRPGRSEVPVRLGSYGRRALAGGRNLRAKLRVVVNDRDGRRRAAVRTLALTR